MAARSTIHLIACLSLLVAQEPGAAPPESNAAASTAEATPVAQGPFAHLPTGQVEYAAELMAAVEAGGVAADTADLLARLERLTEQPDGSRSGLVQLVLGDPLRLPVVGAALGDELGRLAPLEPRALLPDLAAGLGRLADWGAPATLAPDPEVVAAGPPAKGAGIEAQLDWLALRLALAAERVEASQAGLEPGQREHLVAHWRDLGARFDEHIYLAEDPDRARAERNLATIAAGEALDPAPLLEVPALFAACLDPAWLGVLEEELYVAGHDLEATEVLVRATPYGRIVIGGKGDDHHRRGEQGHDTPVEEAVALWIDLGGSDVYADGAATTVNQAGRPVLPVSILIDLAGDDVYAATHDGSIAAGVLGVGLLIDAQGNDRYTGLRWSQAVGFGGLGLLLDGRGNDRYRVQTLGQGVGVWGLGGLIDAYGDDRFEASRYGQGVGLAGGIGLLANGWGSDEYYCKGRWPSSYGTAGVFEGWGQGCGMGFRRDASGGQGLLFDGAGKDRYEAGNFGQGGGYYFGFGGLWDRGLADDRYIGSRYNQGFAAHQAVGYFEERGGDDRYETSFAVASGLAWDESVTAFVEHGGDDVYRGGSFSLGAAAHNAITLFDERGGDDRYLRGPLARAGTNDYHGGTSLSWFRDSGGGADSYPAEAAGEQLDGSATQAPEHAFFRDE